MPRKRSAKDQAALDIVLANVDRGPMARFRELTADPATPQRILQLVAGGDDLNAIARSWDVPVKRFLAWVASNADLNEKCLRARQLAAHELAAEGLEIVDAAQGAETSEAIAAAKLRAEYRLKMARAYHPKVYGEQKQVDVTVKSDLSDYSDEQLQAILDERRPPIDVPSETEPT